MGQPYREDTQPSDMLGDSARNIGTAADIGRTAKDLMDTANGAKDLGGLTAAASEAPLPPEAKAVMLAANSVKKLLSNRLTDPVKTSSQKSGALHLLMAAFLPFMIIVTIFSTQRKYTPGVIINYAQRQLEKGALSIFDGATSWMDDGIHGTAMAFSASYKFLVKHGLIDDLKVKEAAGLYDNMGYYNNKDPYAEATEVFVNIIKDGLKEAYDMAREDVEAYVEDHYDDYCTVNRNHHCISKTIESFENAGNPLDEANIDFSEIIVALSQNEEFNEENGTMEKVKEWFDDENHLRHLYRLNIEDKTNTCSHPIHDEDGDIIDYDHGEYTYGVVKFDKYDINDLYEFCELDPSDINLDYKTGNAEDIANKWMANSADNDFMYAENDLLLEQARIPTAALAPGPSTDNSSKTKPDKSGYQPDGRYYDVDVDAYFSSEQDAERFKAIQGMISDDDDDSSPDDDDDDSSPDDDDEEDNSPDDDDYDEDTKRSQKFSSPEEQERFDALADYYGEGKSSSSGNGGSKRSVTDYDDDENEDEDDEDDKPQTNNKASGSKNASNYDHVEGGYSHNYDKKTNIGSLDRQENMFRGMMAGLLADPSILGSNKRTKEKSSVEDNVGDAREYGKRSERPKHSGSTSNKEWNDTGTFIWNEEVVASQGVWLKDNGYFQMAKTIWQYFKSQGWSDYACAALIGNAHQESSLNPHCSSRPSNPNDYGLFQWTGGRMRKYDQWCIDNGHPEASHTSDTKLSKTAQGSYTEEDFALARIQCEYLAVENTWLNTKATFSDAMGNHYQHDYIARNLSEFSTYKYDSLDDAVDDFLWHWERPAGSNYGRTHDYPGSEAWKRRHGAALEAYNLFSGKGHVNKYGGGVSGTCVYNMDELYTGDYMTTDENALQLIEKVASSDISTQRKQVAIRALANVGNPKMKYDLGGSDYKNPHSVRLDCAGYVSWCYYNSGLDIGKKYTGDMFAEANEKDLTAFYERGIYSIGDAVIAYNNEQYGHTGVVVWVDENGTAYFAHERGSAYGPPQIGIVSQYTSHGGFRRVLHKLDDSIGDCDGSGNSSTSAKTDTSSVTPGSSSKIGLDPSWTYANFSEIHSGKATLYKAADNRKDFVVCVNAGHGCSGGNSKKTYSHPDKTPKVTGGTNAAGAVKSTSISSGMTFNDGTAEAKVTLAEAMILKDKLLAAGYDVLMIRETDDVQLDNIARTVIANNIADCHIALHWDSTGSNKGAFYMSVPNVSSYRSMEPVASHWREHHRLGNCLVDGLRSNGTKIFSNGTLDSDLTQTSFSTIPSVDIELGDKASDHSQAALEKLADGLVAGIEEFAN